MKKVDGCGMECIRMEAGRMEWTASIKAHFHFGCLTFTNVGISRSQSIIRKSGNKGSDFPISEGRNRNIYCPGLDDCRFLFLRGNKRGI